MDPWELTGHAADVASAHLGLVVGGLTALGVAWIVAGIGLHGMRLATWFVPPLLGAVALVLVAGPGRLFAKRYEGATVLGIAPGHSVTALDIPAALAGGLAVLIAMALVAARLTHRGRPVPDRAAPEPVEGPRSGDAD